MRERFRLGIILQIVDSPNLLQVMTESMPVFLFLILRQDPNAHLLYSHYLDV